MLAALIAIAAAQVDAHGALAAPLDTDSADLVRITRPGRLTGGAWFLGAMVGYSERPLVAAGSDGSEVALLRQVGSLQLGAGGNLSDRLRIDVALPLLVVRGSNLQGEPTGGAGIGDLRLRGQLLVVDGRQGFGLALQPEIDLPTGSLVYTGRGRAAGGATVSASYDGGPAAATVQLGLRGEAGDPELSLGGQFMYGVGVSGRVDESIGVHLELVGVAGLVSRPSLKPSGLELIGSVRQGTNGGVGVLAGGSLGLVGGLGVPRLGVFLGATFGAQAVPVARVAVPPGLSVQVLFEGQPLAGVDVVLSGPEERRFVSGATPHRIESAAWVPWAGKATKGECLSGEGAVVVDGETTFDLELERVTTNTLSIQVLRRDGSNAAGALLEFTSSDPHCVPSQFVPVDAEGQAVVELGPGSHNVLALLEGARAEKSFEAVDGARKELFLLLEEPASVPAP